MKDTLTTEKTDVFTNPFLTISDEIFKKWDKERHDDYLVPPHDFIVISMRKNGKRRIIWNKRPDLLSFNEILFAQYKWENFYVWTQGSAFLQQSVGDAMYLNLTIESNNDCDAPHLLIIRPFIYEIARCIESRISKLNIECTSKISIENISDYSLSQKIVPQLVVKK